MSEDEKMLQQIAAAEREQNIQDATRRNLETPRSNFQLSEKFRGPLPYLHCPSVGQQIVW